MLELQRQRYECSWTRSQGSGVRTVSEHQTFARYLTCAIIRSVISGRRCVVVAVLQSVCLTESSINCKKNANQTLNRFRLQNMLPFKQKADRKQSLDPTCSLVSAAYFLIIFLLKHLLLPHRCSTFSRCEVPRFAPSPFERSLFIQYSIFLYPT